MTKCKHAAKEEGPLPAAGELTGAPISSDLAIDRTHPDPDLFLVGHNVRHGYAVMREYQAQNQARYYRCCITRVRAVVERFNRMAARRRLTASGYSARR